MKEGTLKKFDTKGMTTEQGINMIKELVERNTLGTNDELIFNEVIKKLTLINYEDNIKFQKQDKIIKYSFEKLNKKDVVNIAEMLLG